MRESKKLKIALVIGLFCVACVSPAKAQNELLLKGQTGFGAWGGKFITQRTGFGGMGFSFGAEDIVELGMQFLLGDGVDGSGTVVFALHAPTPHKKSTVGLAALATFSENSDSGIGAEIYARLESRTSFLFVPMLTVIHYPSVDRGWHGEVSTTSATLSSHLAFKISSGSSIVFTPQYTTWGDNLIKSSYGVSVGIITFGSSG